MKMGSETMVLVVLLQIGVKDLSGLNCSEIVLKFMEHALVKHTVLKLKSKVANTFIKLGKFKNI